MERSRWLDTLQQTVGESAQIQAIGRLSRFVSDMNVLDILCRTAVDTPSPSVRDAAIDILKANADDANLRFSEIATESLNPARRRWAFICLSRMDCRTAGEAVLKGLQDPSKPVQRAAAMNAGLYAAPEMIEAFKLYFVNNESAFVQEATYRVWELTRSDRFGKVRRRRYRQKQTEGFNPA